MKICNPFPEILHRMKHEEFIAGNIEAEMFAEANNDIVTLWAQFSLTLKFDFSVCKSLCS